MLKVIYCWSVLLQGKAVRPGWENLSLVNLFTHPLNERLVIVCRYLEQCEIENVLNRYFSISHGSIVLVIRVKSLLANFKDTILLRVLCNFLQAEWCVSWQANHHEIVWYFIYFCEVFFFFSRCYRIWCVFKIMNKIFYIVMKRWMRVFV